jgi:hypothetical protein
VYGNNQKIGDAQVLKVTDDSYPDLALLQANLADHSCVYLSEGFLPFDNLYSYGYLPGKYQNGGLMPLPRNGKPITKSSDRDEAFLEVVQGIRKVVEGLKNANPH